MTMTRHRSCLAGLALVLSTGFLGGCDMNAPKEPTREQILKQDAKSQDAMRKYYGNMVGSQSKTRSRSRAR